MMIDYMQRKDVLVWVYGGQPSIHDVQLFSDDQGYYFSLTHRRGTSVLNYTDEEIKKLQEVLHVEHLKLDINNIETPHKDIYKIRVL
jgi:hypothetical protein